MPLPFFPGDFNPPVFPAGDLAGESGGEVSAGAAFLGEAGGSFLVGDGGGEVSAGCFTSSTCLVGSSSTLIAGCFGGSSGSYSFSFSFSDGGATSSSGLLSSLLSTFSEVPNDF